ncbi:OmpA family protein [Pseudomethylobacillus aquaticus]|uniref:OmpA family protein n=1 Tax=Pseudomethylobacillus aquaticus TaxID=2676064 RepID=A0A3N0UY92_9PROT|nr:OmpA family protein [Pseudomethylobacillus aquaticus]ROH85465.1 OmpA family protein [Pseudomethylobacillus aquaticus]
MKNRLIQVALASALAISASAAVAEDAYQGSWYLLPGIGVMNTDKDLLAQDGKPSGFLRIAKEISPHWDIQVGGSYAEADESSQVIAGGDYKQTLFGVDALYMFSREKFRPFLLAGVGLARNKVDYTGTPIGNVNDSKTSAAGSLGLGFQYLFTEKLGMQAEYRHVRSRAEANGDTETIGNDYFNLGVIFKFGAPPPAPAPEPIPVAAAPEPTPEPEPVMAPEPEPVGPAEPAFEKVTLASEVLFAFDKAVLKPEGKAILDNDVVGKMKAHPEVELLLITGHTDRIGDANYNQKLSERRAASVKSYLVSQGVEASRLHAVGKGESEPVADCVGVRGKKAIECLQPNRRVVVEIEVQRQN